MSAPDTCACSCGGETTLIYPCSGSSNVGQLANDLALRLTAEQVGKMSCLAGVGAHLSGFVSGARDCDRAIVIDGCPLRCAGKIFEHVGITPAVYLVLTEHGFTKEHGVPVQDDEVERARALVLARLEELRCSTAS